MCARHTKTASPSLRIVQQLRSPDLEPTATESRQTNGDFCVVGSNGQAIRTGDSNRDDFNSDQFSNADKIGIANLAKGRPDTTATWPHQVEISCSTTPL